MRKLLLGFAVIAFALTACKKDNAGQLDPNAMIALNPAQGVKSATKTNPEHLTALEIVKQATVISWRDGSGTGGWARGFDMGQRDTVNVRLLMFGDDVMYDHNGYVVLETRLIEGVNFILDREFRDENGTQYKIDTIAYIPNSVMRAAEARIKDAFAKEDYATCYKIFDEALTYIPITGAEYEVLKAAGTN